MSIELIRNAIRLEEDRNYNIARLLILISVLNGKSEERSINGIEKLGKLDFLLKHPTILQRAIGNPNVNLRIAEHEKNSVSTRLAEYKYKPWDRKYRELVAIMGSKDLIKVTLNDARHIIIRITPKGIEIATRLMEQSEFRDIAERSKLIKSYFRSVSTNHLTRIVQGSIPRRWSAVLEEIPAL